MDDENFMKEALKEAELALSEGNWPIGCVIVLDEKIIARTHNLVYSTKDKLAHAEMMALQQVKEILHENKNRAILYTTYEPCPMCFGASVLSRINKVVCGIDLDNSGAMYFRDNLPLLFKQKKFSLEFKTGVLAKKCHDVFIQGEPTKELIKEGLIIKSDNADKLDL
jgi:tRNA(adenine34) deaminase